MKRNLAIFLILLISNTALSQQVRKKEKPFIWLSAQCTKSMSEKECAYESQLVSEKNLERSLKLLKKEIDPKIKEDISGFLDAQKAWEVWREKEVLLCYQSAGFGLMGNMTSMQESLCRTRINDERRKQIMGYRKNKLLYDGIEGQL